MKKLSVPMIVALLLAILVVGTTLATSARKQLPFKGSLQAVETHQPNRGSRRVFELFSWLGVGSGKMAMSRPAHQRLSREDHTGRDASR